MDEPRTSRVASIFTVGLYFDRCFCRVCDCKVETQSTPAGMNELSRITIALPNYVSVAQTVE